MDNCRVIISYPFLSASAADVGKLRSEAHVTVPVQVKFVNRTKRQVQIEWITPHGHREKKKVVAPGRCWRTDTWEGHCWVCCDAREHGHALLLNYGRFYWVHKSAGYKERVIISEGKFACIELGVHTIAAWRDLFSTKVVPFVARPSVRQLIIYLNVVSHGDLPHP